MCILCAQICTDVRVCQCMSVCMSVCVVYRLRVALSVCVSACLFVCLQAACGARRCRSSPISARTGSCASWHQTQKRSRQWSLFTFFFHWSSSHSHQFSFYASWLLSARHILYSGCPCACVSVHYPIVKVYEHDILQTACGNFTIFTIWCSWGHRWIYSSS